MIAMVAGLADIGRADASPLASKPGSPRAIAAEINIFLRTGAGTTETIRFADPRKHSVRVVRGRKPPAAANPDRRSDKDLSARGADEVVAFSDKRKKPVRVVRGGPIVATVSVVIPATSPGPPPRPAMQVVSFVNSRERPVTVLRGMAVARVDLALPAIIPSPYLDLFGAARGAELDRVAFAIDGAESSHGGDPGMWRAVFNGPQGPMQVSAAAAIDSGGGDRFDLSQNRLLGRTYLARLYRRYGNWPDAVSAYNWGPGNLDAWIAQGRPAAGLPLGVERYRERVLREGGISQTPGDRLARTSMQLQSR
ncbi:MAG: lytic transglycosylase domain-containing protein [Stellaceae bacterium]